MMTEESLFALALKTPEAERDALLDRACEGKPELRARVEVLLKAEVASAPLPAEPDICEAPTVQPSVVDYFSGDKAGTAIGPYKLLQKLGEGGMGTVWVAEQEQPVKRRVALKLVKAGMDSAMVIRRFEAERQALAMMDHTNIARVFDAGTTTTGRPYFVMELVKGVPITRYCDEVHSSIQDRLELFIQVCSAVQHAHQKGVIHRDIKPSNVLIAMQDGKPVPKVIDFGVAKALHTKLADRTMYTEIGQIIGTLEYMSPEQAELSAMDIDTRADIYALGVLLYEILTGSTPITHERMKSEAFVEVIRLIKEEEPPRPSTRLSQSKESLANLASLRRIDPKKLSSTMRGELDWVVMKALEKDRTRRYETANGLARDIQRYLADEVVEARAPTAGYRLKKFVRRNVGKVIAASLVLGALLLGIVGTTWGLFRANAAAEGERVAKVAAEEQKIQAEHAAIAEKLAKEQAQKERDAKEQQRKYAQAIADFVQNDFFALTSVEGQDRFGGENKEALDRNTTLGQLLDRAAEKLRARKDLDSRTEAKLCWIIGVNYRSTGDASKGIDFLKRAVNLQTDLHGRNHPFCLEAINSLAVAYQAAGKLDMALPLFEEVQKLRKAMLGPDQPDTLSSMNNLAVAYTAAEKLDLALPLLEETLKLRKVILGTEHPDTLLSMIHLAVAYRDAGKLDLALPLFEETLKLMKAKLGPDHPYALISMNHLAVAYQHAGKLELALPLFEEALKLMQAKLGPEHPHTLNNMGCLAKAYTVAGKLDLALPLYEETLKLSKAKLGPDHPDNFTAMTQLAMGYQAAGKMDRALTLYEGTLKLSTVKLGADHPNTQTFMHNLAWGYQTVGKIEKALPLYEQAATAIEKLRFKHEYVNLIIPHTIAAYESASQFDKAGTWQRKWLAIVKAESGTDSPAYTGELAKLSLLLLKQQKWTEAETIVCECLAIRERTQPDDWRTFNTQSLLGGALLGQKRYAEAEPLLLKGFEGMKQREKTIPPVGSTRIPETLDRLIQLYTETKKPDDVKKWQAEKEKLPKPGEKK